MSSCPGPHLWQNFPPNQNAPQVGQTLTMGREHSGTPGVRKARPWQKGVACGTLAEMEASMKAFMKSAVSLSVIFWLPACVWKADFEALQEKQRGTLVELKAAQDRNAALEAEKAALQGNLERTQQELQKKIAGLEETLSEKQRESEDSLKKKEAELEEARRTGSEKLAGLQAEYDAARAEAAKQISGAEQELQQARGEAEAAEKKVKEMGQTYDSLVDTLKEEIEQKEVKISRLKGNLQIDLVDKILFDSGSAQVNARGRKVLQKVSNALKKIGDRRVVVEGHTDDQPIRGGPTAERFPTNWELSSARAIAVVRLLDEFGVPSDRLSGTGYGPFRPVASNATAEGRGQNRRIEILLEPLRPAEVAR